MSGEVGDVEQDDEAVMRACVHQPELFEGIFDRHHDAIWAYLARVGGRDCADDLASEVFLTAFRRRGHYDPGRGSVRAWLYGIASHQARTRLRGQLRAARALPRAASRDRVSEAPAQGAVEDAIIGRDRLDRVREALTQLSDDDREVIVLYAWERLSYEEIASALEIKVGTVRSRLSRARARLRELADLSGELTGEGTPQ